MWFNPLPLEFRMEYSHMFITFAVARTCKTTLNFFLICKNTWTLIFVFFFCSSRNGKRYIYNVLDWEKPQKAMVMVFGTLILAITVHIILFWIYKLRVFVQRRFFGTELILPTKSKSPSGKSLGSQISMVFGDDGCTNEAFKNSPSIVFK